MTQYSTLNGASVVSTSQVHMTVISVTVTTERKHQNRHNVIGLASSTKISQLACIILTSALELKYR
jgi:hypothetical protein